MTRTAVISEAFLRWLSTTEHQPPPEEFLDAPASVVDGSQVTRQELVPAVQRLVDYGLLSDRLGAWGSAMPLRSRLTSDGRICVTDFDGDVDAWAKRNALNVDQSVNVTAGRDAQVAAHSQHVTQVQNTGDVNLGELRRAAGLTRDALPALALPEAAGKDVTEATEAILAEVDKPEPDREKLKGLGERLRNGVALAAGGGTILKLIIEALGAAGL